MSRQILHIQDILYIPNCSINKTQDMYELSSLGWYQFVFKRSIDLAVQLKNFFSELRAGEDSLFLHESRIPYVRYFPIVLGVYDDDESDDGIGIKGLLSTSNNQKY